MTLLGKLQWKDQPALVLLDAPADVASLLASPTGPRILTRIPRAGVSFLLACVRTPGDVARTFARVAPVLTEDALVWFAYPKKSSKRHTATISRDCGWDAPGRAGYEPVRQVALDEDWSALRFRRVEKIPRLTRHPSRMISRRGTG